MHSFFSVTLLVVLPDLYIHHERGKTVYCIEQTAMKIFITLSVYHTSTVETPHPIVITVVDIYLWLLKNCVLVSCLFDCLIVYCCCYWCCCKQSSDSGEISDVAMLLHRDPLPRRKVLFHIHVMDLIMSIQSI